MVANLINSKGNAVANQFILTDGKTIGFQSYKSLVCEIRGAGMGFDNNIVLGKDWAYSRTTMKHLCSFLVQNGFTDLATKKDIESAISHTERYGHTNINGMECAVWYDDTMK